MTMIPTLLMSLLPAQGTASIEQDPSLAAPRPLAPTPSPRQLAWQEREYYAFVHFNMNTFTDHEWGEGREDPMEFAPTELDCRQWARVAKAAGMSGIILTAKHHDGFCLWPSEFTEHDVASSPWKDGQGDVLRELSDACREYGLGFGVYLSPWDRNHPEYGNSPVYNEFFAGQLREVLSSYGEVFEVWFDGACGEGPNGKRQEYDWPLFHGVVRELQPQACMFSDSGPDVRWVGNERGFAGETNWSTIRADEFYPGCPNYLELQYGHRDGPDWLPAECDVSIRPGWYYHASEDDQVKGIGDLLDIWYGSVGRNGNLLLNLPVDRRGLVHETDEARLMELREVLDATFAHNLAVGARIGASNIRRGGEAFGPAQLLDGDPSTYWAADEEVDEASIVLDFDEAVLFDRVELREPIALGQRIGAFRVDVVDQGAWRKIAEGTTVGNRRILRVGPQETQRLRISVYDTRACPLLSEVGLYLAPPEVRIHAEATEFIGSMEVRCQATLPGWDVRITLDGSEPTAESALLDSNLTLSKSCVLRARAFRGEVPAPRIAEQRFTAYGADDLVSSLAFFRPPDPGLGLWTFEQGFQSVVDMPTPDFADRRIVEGVSIDHRPRDEHVGLLYRGFLQVPEDGIYTFHLTSDDGSSLRVAETLELQNDGLHGAVRVEGSVGLEAGWHAVELRYFNATGGASLGLEIEGPDGQRRPVPKEAWFH